MTTLKRYSELLNLHTFEDRFNYLKLNGSVGRIYIHHMNPITVEDFKNDSMLILSPEYLISVSLDTHNAIHYGNKNYATNKLPIERRPGDTCPWKQLR